MTFTVIFQNGDIDVREIGLNKPYETRNSCETMMALSVPDWASHLARNPEAGDVEFRCLEVLGLS